MKKKAFTLTELLVVVVIIGVLSAVVLPKFTKVLQTRKTTEAENIMGAVRNEQEARCMIGRNYVGQNEIGKLASLPKATSKNYTYTLDAQGITATAKDGNYILQIPSYTDGRICCSGEGCDGLNKDYPKCGTIADLETAMCEVPEPEPPQGCGEKPAQPADEPCGCNNTGHKSYTWNEAACKWEIGATCEGEDTAPCEIPACVKPAQPADELCGCNNTGHKSYTWNEAECKWEIGTTCEGEEDCSTCTEGEQHLVSAFNGCAGAVRTCQNGKWVVESKSGNETHVLKQKFEISHPGAETRENACSAGYGTFTCSSSDKSDHKVCNEYILTQETCQPGNCSNLTIHGEWRTEEKDGRSPGMSSTCQGVPVNSISWGNGYPVRLPDPSTTCKQNYKAENEARGIPACTITGNDIPHGAGLTTYTYYQTSLYCTATGSTKVYMLTVNEVQCCADWEF